jgi:aldehyde:ferredoxin oxidoreductase
MSSGFRQSGTIGDLAANDDGGDWPTKNWQSNSWGKGIELLDHYEEKNFVRSYGCYKGCSIRCGRKVKVDGGAYETPEHGGAEYESISSFTAFVLNEDMDAAIHCSYLCNEYGLDTISAGAVIAFAMECFEKGILNQADFGDIDPNWGATASLPCFLELIAKRQGIGDLLAEGVKAASKQLGEKARSIAIHVKGMEGPAHDPRCGKSLALAYGTANRGMCHIHPVEAMAWDSGKMDWGLMKYGLTDPELVDPWKEEGKGKDLVLLQNGMILPDILGTCKFFMYAGITLDHWAQILSALTGWQIQGADLLIIGERVFNLQRMFNIREGLTCEDDMLPMRALSIPKFGKYKDQPDCVTHSYPDMLQDYYKHRGWDVLTGIPTREKLVEMGLN